MKTSIYIIMFFVLSLLIGLSPKINTFTNKIYIIGDSLKISSLHFLNDSICIYTQEFSLDIDLKYQKTEIKCFYKIDKDKIILKNIECPEYLESVSCFTLTDTIRSIYETIFVKNTYPSSLHNSQLLQAAGYGYINSIDDIDTLFYYKGHIIYDKIIECFMTGIRARVTCIFQENENRTFSEKQLKRMFSSRKLKKIMNKK